VSTDPGAIDRLARAALASYALDPGSTVDLINVSENWTFRVREPAGGRQFALRVHRPGYHTAAEIGSELDWIDALREDGIVDAAHAVPGVDGVRVCQVQTPELGERNVVLFEWLSGDMPDPDAHDLLPGFRTLGAVSARMHRHSRSWTRPAGFVRFAWDYETTIGERGHWGRWQDGLGMGADERALLGRLDATLRRRLEIFGRSPQRFGLVHADIRLANLLVDGESVRVIDFDDCGLSWFMYDFATTVSFIEDHPDVPELKQAWVDGYRSVAPLDAADEAELDTFVMLRRLLLVAWIGSHHEFATEAAELGAGFTAGSCTLAERYLSQYD
jgi:Ser/Thr protein kinase RdoA (MazF antagonist)